MKRKKTRRAFTVAALLLPALMLTHCGKKEEADNGGGDGKPGIVETILPSTPFGDKADKLGAAVLLPSDTEFYVGSVNLKGHLEALKKTSWWKDINALIEDKTPAPSTDNESLETLKQLWGDEVFIAGGAGFSQSVSVLRDINRLYNELNFRTLMEGSTSGMAAGMPGSNPMGFLFTALNDPDALSKVSTIVNNLEVLPLVIGVKTENPQEKLNKLITEQALKEIEAKKIPVTDHTTPDGKNFKTASIDVGVFYTAEAQKTMLESLPPDLPEEARQSIEKTLVSIRSKKLQVAWGVVGDYIVFASGKNLDHLKFAEDPSKSLLANPALEKLVPLAEKNLLSLMYSSKETLLAMHDDQPFVPMLRGVVAAMKANAMFAEAGAVLDTQLNELSPLEQTVFGRKASDIAGAGWWDKGLHAEAFGGLEPVLFTSAKPLNYAGLLEQEKLLFGMTYHGNPEHDQAVRAWMEKIFGMVYTGAKEVIKAGVAGAEGQQKIAFFEMLVLPTLQKIYQSSKDIKDKGEGNETAFILDVAGKPPTFLAESSKVFPRITLVNEVKNRAEIATGWNAIQDTLNGVAAMLGGLGGGAGAAEGGAPPSFIPEFEKSEQDGFTTWAYKLELLDEDLTPNSTLSDKHLILSTSRPAAAAISKFLNQPATETRDGLLWAMDFSVLASTIETGAKNIPNQTDEKKAEMEQLIKWLKPFKRAEGQVHHADGTWHNILNWEIQDTVSFD